MPDYPLFYVPVALEAGISLTLPEDTARHVGQVLRMQVGETLLLTNGKGMLATCRLVDSGKKKSTALIEQIVQTRPVTPKLHLAIAFTKNASRNEWLLEKATELGVSIITPLLAERSIRDRARPDRWNAILVSAMIQSKQTWLPMLRDPSLLETVLKENGGTKLIAHCMDDTDGKTSIIKALKCGDDALVLIGPEGDFSPAEVTLAKEYGVIPISLGRNRLRTETAALAAITHFYLTNHAS